MDDRAERDAVLRDERARAARAAELRAVTELMTPPAELVSTDLFDVGPLHEVLPAAFDELAVEFGALVEERAAGTDDAPARNTTPRLRALSVQLGLLNAGPRDVVALYDRYMSTLGDDGTEPDLEARFTAARITLLHLMGLIATYYRRAALIDRRRAPDMVSDRM